MTNPSFSLEQVIGIGGDVPDSVVLHPDGHHVLYPLGSAVVIQDKSFKGDQAFFQVHDHLVSCVAVSPTGRYIASGQLTHPGFLADILIWDFETLEVVHRFSLHKEAVKALAFSPCERYLASLGGIDDGSVVVWDVQGGAAICGSPASSKSQGHSLSLAWFNNDSHRFITGGDSTLRVWELDMNIRKILATDFRLGSLKRVVTTMRVSGDDSTVICGTSTGDILSANCNTMLFQKGGPTKAKLSKGISTVLLNEDMIMVGSGDGTLAVLGESKNSFRIKATVSLLGRITNIMEPSPGNYRAVTDLGNVYEVDFDGETFTAELKVTAHAAAVKQIAFAPEYNKLFVTCGGPEVRVWARDDGRELLRVVVPNVECQCVSVMPDGQGILSGWADGKIRMFSPETGRLKFAINDAHVAGVTAVAGTADCGHVISGGGRGQVRVWRIGTQSQSLLATLKEHSAAVTSLHLTRDNSEAVSAAADGSIIAWDLVKEVRNAAMYQNTAFKDVAYHPEESQVVSVGTDRRLVFWDVIEGLEIRKVDAAEKGDVTAVDVSYDGDWLITAGMDTTLKLFDYDLGELVASTPAHSAGIRCARIAPCGTYVVCGCDDGSVFVWSIVRD